MKTVLVVDDSAFMRNMIKKHISELDVTVVGEAEDGKVAVEKFLELKPDIITLDLAMHDHDGVEALKEMKKHDPEAKVVVLSSTTDQDSVADEVTELGAYAVLNKPIVKEDLIATLSELISN